MFFIVSAVFAQPRTANEALKIAKSFVADPNANVLKNLSLSSDLDIAYVCADKENQQNAHYYVFNFGDEKGFVIISGDLRAKEVLGYSTNGNFDMNNIPDNFKAWLSFYEEELTALSKTEVNDVAFNNIELLQDNTEDTFAASIAPLVKTKWNQVSPYNLLCPTDNTTSQTSVTGCVATAMAQIMKYHEWPTIGTGSNTYTTPKVTGDITIDFSQTTYDWENMKLTYSGSETADEKNAVATLMFHCGVAVNMIYSSIESGAYDKDVAPALVSYFGYDNNHQMIARDYYSTGEFKNILKKELNESRPVYYTGRSSGGGHAFVCSGYDANDLFHFNWGWGGVSDGYFEISALNPSSLGTGGGSGGYNTSQSIIVGIQKPNPSSTAYEHQIMLNEPISVGVSSVGRNDTYNVSLKGIFNRGSQVFSGAIVVGLYNQAGELKAVHGFTTPNLNPGYGWDSQVITASVPAEIANGEYKLYPMFSLDQSNWTKIRTKTGTPQCINVTVTDTEVIFSASTEGLPSLSRGDINVEGNLYRGKYLKLNVAVTNNGDGDYNSNILVYLRNIADNSINSFVISDPVNIAPGETKTFEYLEKLPMGLTPGNYQLAIMYDPNNNRASLLDVNSIGAPIIVEILPAPVINSQILVATSPISFPDNSNVTPSSFNLEVKLKNTGDYFSNVVYAFYDGKNGYYYGFDSKVITLESNEETTLYFTNPPAIPFGENTIAILYDNELTNGKVWLGPGYDGRVTFIYKEDMATQIDNIVASDIKLYPNPVVESMLYLESEKTINSVSVFDLAGKKLLNLAVNQHGIIEIPVQNLSTGLYILHADTEEGIKTMKFNKK